jgi:hypothetical protein
MSYGYPPHLTPPGIPRKKPQSFPSRFGSRSSVKNKSRPKYEGQQPKDITALLTDAVFCPNDDYRMIPGKWHSEDNPQLFLYGYICGRCGFKFNPFHTEEKIATHGVQVGTLDGSLDENAVMRPKVTESVPMRTSKKMKEKSRYEKTGLDPMILRDAEVTTPPGDIIKERIISFRGRRFKI